MAVQVVHFLEVVDVDHRQVMIVLTGPDTQFAASPRHKGAAVGDLGQGVDVGLLNQQFGQGVVEQLHTA